jgi:methionyl aminopeptidase
MRTMHPVLKRGALFWDQELLPRACYVERFARVRSRIVESGDDAWLLYGDVERYGHVAYVSNFLPRTRSALALVAASGDPAMLVNVGLRDVPAAKTLTWIDDVRPFGALAPALRALILDKRLAKARLGLVGVEEQLSLGEWNEITAVLPQVQWQLRTAAAARLRESKDRFELAALRRAARAVANALDRVPHLLRAGLTARSLAAAVDRELRRAAAEDVRILIAVGPQCGLSLRPPDDRMLQEGDTIMLYAAAEVQRYWGEAACSYVLGRGSREQQALAERAAAALAAMRAAAVPGTRVSGIHAIGENVLDDAALCASAKAYGFGHGIGLDPEEAPMLGPRGDDCLVENATMALRVIGHSNGHGIALGQVIVVGANGDEPLLDAPGLTEVRPSGGGGE